MRRKREIFKNFPTGKYNVVVIDPPWEIQKFKNKGKSFRLSDYTGLYSMLSIDQISTLPIKNIMADTCFVFLWTIQKYLGDSFKLLEQYGCKYLLTLVWEKTFGISAGRYMFGFRYNCEFILVGHVGKINPFIKLRFPIPACFQASNVGHSIKPDLFYKYVEQLGEKRVDLFARQQRPGWDVWGDQV